MVSFQYQFNPKAGKRAKELIENSFKKMKTEKNSHKIGYYLLPQTSKQLLQEIEEFKTTNPYIKKALIKDIVIVGIGGSSLGTKAIYQILKHQQNSKIKLHFLENGDPIEITSTLKKLKKEKTLFVVISKSGTTIETISIFKYILKRFKISLEQKADINRLLAITDNDSALSQFANKYTIKQFHIPKNVGGRFSVLSAVGIVPLGLAGFKIEKLLAGAKKFKNSFFKKQEQHILEKAYFYYKNSKHYPINVVFSYSSLFSYFNQWYVQLWGESLGKIDKLNHKVGLTPIGLVGSIDQHSFLQLIIQGPSNKTVSFIKIKEFHKRTKIPKLKLDYLEKTDFINGYRFNKLLNEQCNATCESLIDENIPVDNITLDCISEENLGILICYYELLTSALGNMFDINTYNQPGVEFGKKKLLNKFQGENKL